MRIRTGMIALLLACLVGCATDTVDRDLKRSQDRLAIELSKTQAERDQYKTGLDRAQNELAEARKGSTDSSEQVKLLRKQVQDLQNANTQLSAQNDKLKTDLSR